MQDRPTYLSIDYAKDCNPEWAEDPRLYAIIMGLNAWGIDALHHGDESDESSGRFAIPFRHGPALQMVVAAWNRSGEDPGLKDRVPFIIASANRHYLYPISYFDGDKQKSMMAMVEFGNFLLSLPFDFDWLPDKLFMGGLNCYST